jgi:TonB family protein
MSDLELNSIAPKADRAFPAESRRRALADSKQRGLMVGSLCLLLLALGIVLWHDRDFWFPDASEAEVESDQPVENSPVATAVPVQPPAAVTTKASSAKPKHQAPLETRTPDPETPAPPMAIVANRTVLPPLEVEVIAGDTHRTIRPGSSSVHVDLQPGAPSQPATDPVAVPDSENAANLTSEASERVQMSPDASQVLARPVKPSYPLLARQMKVQGSVILKALIGKDGIIQNLSVVSGPHILASAAEDAVRQWHFKPHLQGRDAVETEAKITVNFTISTN